MPSASYASSPALNDTLRSVRESACVIDIHDHALWPEFAIHFFMISSFPPLFFPKGTTREATAETVRKIIGLLQRLASIYLEADAQLGRVTPENGRKWFTFLSGWASKTGNPVNGGHLATSRASVSH